MNRGAMVMKEYSAFPKAPASLEPQHQIVYCHIRTLVGGSFSSAEVQSVYFTAPANWATRTLVVGWGQSVSSIAPADWAKCLSRK